MHTVCFVIIPKEVYDFEKTQAPEAWIQGHVDEVFNKNEGEIGFDWYVIGGRWNGMLIKDHVRKAEHDDYEDRVEDNCVSVEELLALYKSGDIEAQPDLITSDGIFHQHLGVGKEDSYMNLLEKEIGNYVVNVDYHF